MAEIKKGYSEKDLVSILERRALAPYPSWATWEHNLEKEIGEDVYKKQFTDEQKETLHIWYMILTKSKLGKNVDSDLQKYGDLHRKLEEEKMDESYNVKFDHAITFLWERVSKFR